MTENDLHQPFDPIDPTVRFLRLFCGDDIIAWVSVMDEGYFIEDPVVVLVDIDAELQKQTCILMPWLPRGIVVGNDCTLKEEDILFFKKVEPDVEAYYKKLCVESLRHQPKIFDVRKPNKNDQKNVFGFDMSKVRPLKGVQNEQKEEKVNSQAGQEDQPDDSKKE